MVSRELVAAKLGDLADRIARVRAHHRATVDELQSDRDALDLVSFNLMLAVQSCVDVASHIVADEGWRPATSLGDGFDRLHQRGVLSAPTARALQRAAGLRNVVAHGYAGVDPATVHAASTQGLGDLEAFAREVAQWLDRSPGGATTPRSGTAPSTRGA